MNNSSLPTKILVIEDEPELLEAIVDILRFANFDVLGTGRGSEGLLIAEKTKPDLIISDLMMEGVNGYDVVKSIRNNPATSTIPVIILTAKADWASQRLGMSLGADDYITKPFQEAELLQAIYARIDRQEEVMRGLENAKQQLMTMVTHEFRTPLVPMMLAEDYLIDNLEDISSEEMRTILLLMQRGSKRLHRLVEQVIRLVELEIDHWNEEGNWQQHSIENILTMAIGEAQKHLHRPSTAEVMFTTAIPNHCVRSIASLIIQGFAEIILNAITFSPPGGTVLISTEVEYNQIVVNIADRGNGMLPEHIREVFRPFHQINRAKTEQQGIGIGLTLAYHIFSLHKGFMTITSEPGQGTCVQIRLPLS